MKQFHSLPSPKEMGFEWEAFEEAHSRIKNVSERRRQAERTAQDLQQRINHENEADVQALADAIAAGKPDPAPPGLEGLVEELREQQRLSKALEQAGPRAEGELSRVCQENREAWAEEVDAALEKALEAERKAYEKAQQAAMKARARRTYLEELSRWIRTTPPVFSPPGDAIVPSAFGQLSQDADRAQRQMLERQEHEAEVRAENERRLRLELGEDGAA